ncbi:c2h2 type zinc finger containing [Fusarium sporotrichioides]|uniref:C2h2 type zinc finger containing n=1 Tax=Fusarium sporotrichioides TaxID=5514 RepID=A0A395S0R0_FUSSP|nr:c2h2 type zinc finger containing [Fusarium sporotrichioides]
MASRWFTLALLLTPSLALKNDFSFYPAGAQECLEKNADDASCTGSDAKELNYCLCGLGNYNNDFILGSARCIGQESPNDVDETYDMMNEACSNSNTPMKTSKKDFQQAAHDGETTTTAAGTSASATASATDTASTTSGTAAASTSDASDADADTGLSTGATIGVGVGAAAGGAAIVGLVIWLWLHRRKKNAEESHPMLPNYESHNNSPYPPVEPKAAWGTTPASGWQTPDPNASGYYAQQKQHAGPVELPPDNLVAAPAPVFEMDGTSSGAVEMPGSTPVNVHHRGSDELSRAGLGSSAGDTAMVSPQTQPGTPYRPHREINQ